MGVLIHSGDLWLRSTKYCNPTDHVLLSYAEIMYSGSPNM